MEQNFEQNIPFVLVISVFIFLLLLSTVINKRLRERKLVKEGQVFLANNQIPTIEQRVKGNQEWASGKIVSSGRFLVFALWLFAIVWSLTLGGAFFNTLFDPNFKIGGKIALGVFTLLGTVIIYFAIKVTIRQFRFGQSFCFINGKAGVIGKEISGTIRTSTEVRATGDYTIIIQCIETYSSGSGKNRTTKTDILFQEKKLISKPGHSSKIGIPFSFLLPPYPPETGYQLSRGDINWQLSISAPVDGVDYYAIFIVPVFKMD